MGGCYLESKDIAIEGHGTGVEAMMSVVSRGWHMRLEMLKKVNEHMQRKEKTRGVFVLMEKEIDDSGRQSEAGRARDVENFRMSSC